MATSEASQAVSEIDSVEGGARTVSPSLESPHDLMESAWKVTYLDKPETGLVAVSVSRRFAVRTDAGDADANAGASNNHAPSEKATPASGSPSLTQADGTTLAPMAEKYSFDSSRIRGVSFPPWLRETRWEDLTKKVQLRPSDILVATYPKRCTKICVLIFIWWTSYNSSFFKHKSEL